MYTWFLLISIRGWRAELGCGGLELRAWERTSMGELRWYWTEVHVRIWEAR